MSKRHVILGGGPAAINAVETLRQFDDQCQITMVCDEPAHSRMALPYWLSGQIPRQQTHIGDPSYFQRLRVDARIGVRARQIDAEARQVVLDDDERLDYDTLLLATGSSPTGLQVPGIQLPGVQPLWSLHHVESALNATDDLERPRVVLIGAGFIGLIVLNAMFKRGWHLEVVERQSQVLPTMLDETAAQQASQWLQQRGVQVHCGRSVESIEPAEGQTKRVLLNDGHQIEADLVIVATGVRPNLELARTAGLETDLGVLVDDRMQTSIPSIFAAGDVAQGPALFSEQRQVHAIQPTAVDHGRVAGANMAGQEVHYPGSLAMNVLDVCGLQCASYGNWFDASAEAMTMDNPSRSIYRKLLWTDDCLSGAIFVGQANDVGMLTDVGMIKGILQTRTPLGPWKEFLRENPFDIRRAFVATRVAEKLASTTLLGRPAQARGYRFQNAAAAHRPSPAHAEYVHSRPTPPAS